ncbi:class II glutamine amidotransferase [Streptomyces sp. NPDC050263]|uniref:class II glutamine amidotransferase n=1 Tax=Streptomyces sp. NPDC050263 TaxID=3155037 RepID=UPI003427F07E
MCRWLAYSGTPVLLETILYRPAHSLIDQSLHSRMGVETTNGDGFGIGWYAPDADDGSPAVVREIGPAWSNRNLREIAGHVRSPLFFAHIRASTGTAVQQTNSHPFRHGRWMWMHNGAIADFHLIHRELALAVDPELFPDIEGSTDSEMMFFLALTLGLEEDPPGAVARMAGLVERVGHAHGVEFPLQMTIAVTDGERLWAFRYSSQGTSRSLFYSTRVETLRALHPDLEFLREVSDETRLVVSEPLGDLPGAWNKVPEGTYGVVQPGASADDIVHFAPQAA